MRSTTLLFGFGQLAAAQYYALLDDYNPSNFFDQFNFMTFENGDGTGGFVDYKDRPTAQNSNLIHNFGHSVVFRADNTTQVLETSKGRPAVRLEGKKKYNKGIIVADIQHMPGNACGSWPAFWSFGDNWPHDGEIDIIEGVNSMTQNKVSLHAGNAVCTVQNSGNADLGVPALNNGQQAFDCRTMTGNNEITNSVGCGIDAPSGLPNTFGDGFNSVNGGFYATQWTSNFIKVWFWPRGTEPETLHCDVPDVSKFGTPLAFFQGNCAFGDRFSNQHLVFSTNFCGSWAGAVGVYDQEFSRGCENYGLATPDLSCRREVATKPSKYTNQYWEVNGIKVPYTTKYTTTIVDVCPTGLTTSTVTTSVLYCPMCHERPTSPYNGFVEEVKVCSKGCAPTPVPVTVTVPYDGAYNGVKPTGDAKGSYDAKPVVSGKGSYDAKPVVSAKGSGAVEPYWSAKATASGKPAYGGDYNVDAKPAGGAYTPKAYTPSGASNPVYTTSKTYQPVLATVNGASTTFASAFVMVAAAFAAVLMM